MTSSRRNMIIIIIIISGRGYAGWRTPSCYRRYTQAKGSTHTHTLCNAARLNIEFWISSWRRSTKRRRRKKGFNLKFFSFLSFFLEEEEEKKKREVKFTVQLLLVVMPEPVIIWYIALDPSGNDYIYTHSKTVSVAAIPPLLFVLVHIHPNWRWYNSLAGFPYTHTTWILVCIYRTVLCISPIAGGTILIVVLSSVRYMHSRRIDWRWHRKATNKSPVRNEK